MLLAAIEVPALGGSLEYPEVARAIEIAFKTRLSDTVTQADLGIAYGTAIKVTNYISYFTVLMIY